MKSVPLKVGERVIFRSKLLKTKITAEIKSIFLLQGEKMPLDFAEEPESLSNLMVELKFLHPPTISNRTQICFLGDLKKKLEDPVLN